MRAVCLLLHTQECFILAAPNTSATWHQVGYFHFFLLLVFHPFFGINYDQSHCTAADLENVKGMKERKGMKANKPKGTEKQNRNKSSVTAWPTQRPWEVRRGWVLHGFQGTPGHLGGLVYRLITSLEYPGGTFPSEILSKLGWITWEVLYVNLKVKNYNGSPKYLLVFFLYSEDSYVVKLNVGTIAFVISRL